MDIILNVPENATWDSLTEDQQAVIRAAQGQWPEERMPFTRVYEGRKLVTLHVESTLPEIEGFILQNKLDWTVEAAKDQAGTIKGYDPKRILPFIPDIVTYDENGNEVSRTRPTEVPELNRYMGSPPWEAAE